MNKKRIHGQFYTTENPFGLNGFKEWWSMVPNKSLNVLEPFAGSNNIITMLQSEKLIGSNFSSFDIDPKSDKVNKQDTIKKFPKGYSIVITNPPYLANNVASRRKLNTKPSKYDDLYKDCLELCLNNSDWVAAIIPESFINADIFQDRLFGLIELTSPNMFADTQHPTCLAMFIPPKLKNITKVWRWNEYLGELDIIRKTHLDLLTTEHDCKIQFNKKNGQLGLVAIDNTVSDSISFVNASELRDSDIEATSRTKTRILLEPPPSDIKHLISELNKQLATYRLTTHDIYLTPFKGLRKDLKYRRRIDYATAKKLIYTVLNDIKKP